MNNKEIDPKMQRLESFREIIDSSNDLEMTTAAKDLLADMITISNLKEQIEKVEQNLLSDNKRSFYYFFLEGLTPFEIVTLSDKCLGRVKILENRLEKERAATAAKEAELAKQAEVGKEEESEIKKEDDELQPAINSEAINSELDDASKAKKPKGKRTTKKKSE